MESSLPEGVFAPYDWALDQIRAAEAHATCQGSPEITVAVVDLGYRFHPDHEGHLWRNPHPSCGDLHGWDFADDDASLEYTGPDEDTSAYYRGHHSFIVGEVSIVAPSCPIMVLRVGYLPGQGASWSRAVDYAVEHGARVLIIPHGYIQGHCATGVPFFYQGTDFGFPFDNPELKRTYDDAYAAGCLIVSGVSDNRGRRAAYAATAFEPVMAIGSSDRRGEAADIAASSDYVEVAAPAGRRSPEDPCEQIWGTGGDNDYIPMTGGCMASGFAGGVAALAMSRYPDLTNRQVRQILRNTARGEGWDHQLGHGIIDAAAAVNVTADQRQKSVVVDPSTARLQPTEGGLVLSLEAKNESVLDVEQALVVAYTGDPTMPSHPQATLKAPVELSARQIGHARVAISGRERIRVSVALQVDTPPRALYVQAFACDAGAPSVCHTSRLSL